MFGPGDDEPLVWYEGSGTSDRRWLHADERGSVIAVTNGSGALIGTNSYDEYGVPGSANIGKFQYAGQAHLPDFGLYYYKARIYSSRLGRFLQTDPIGYGDGPNWYNYVGGDPVNGSDSLGLACDPSNGDGCLITVVARDGSVSYTGPEVVVTAHSGSGGNTGSTGTGTPPDVVVVAPQNNNCAPGISPAESAASAAGDRNKFWNSRASRGDPMAATALSIVNNSSDIGMIANMRLRDAITTRSPGMSVGAVSAEVQQIGVQLMRAHVSVVNTFGSPSAGQIAAYHFQVFGAHNLPNTTFGGSMMTGTEAEAWVFQKAWLRCP